MSRTALEELLAAGLEQFTLTVTDREREGLLTYLALLARWNRRINLTAFDLDRPTPAAIERLVLEPLAAAALVEPGDRQALDIGSGGGSPAIPLAIVRSQLVMTMVEVRQKKAAFLREVSRELGLASRVEARRFEDVARDLPRRSIDVVTLRAVRPDVALVRMVEPVLSRHGRLIVFGNGHITETELLYWSSQASSGVEFVVGRSCQAAH